MGLGDKCLLVLIYLHINHLFYLTNDPNIIPTKYNQTVIYIDYLYAADRMYVSRGPWNIDINFVSKGSVTTDQALNVCETVLNCNLVNR